MQKNVECKIGRKLFRKNLFTQKDDLLEKLDILYLIKFDNKNFTSSKIVDCLFFYTH